MMIYTQFDIGDKIHVTTNYPDPPFDPGSPHVVQRIEHSFDGTFYYLIDLKNGELKRYPERYINYYCQEMN